MEISFLIFYLSLFIIAFLYGSVGHGGASGYIALMALSGWLPTEIRVNALLLNVAVASLASVQFVRKEKPELPILLFLLLGSVPAAFLGGSLGLESKVFKWVLALCLLVPVFRFSGLFKIGERPQRKPCPLALLLTGAAIGLVSGLIGIGGGVVLTPVLVMAGWAGLRQAALLSALFIVANSVAGLLGLWQGNTFALPGTFLPLAMVAMAGGTVGAYLSAQKFSLEIVRKILAAVLFLAVCKLLLTA